MRAPTCPRAPITTRSRSISRLLERNRPWSNSSKRTERVCNVSPEEIISELHTAALAALAQATTLDAIEAVRVEALGRKGKLAEVSKTFGKLTPEERASTGKLLNSVKQDLATK